ncbi:MAG: hypothetical protein R2720_04575 [Candidatus Nanopelagicales bacterium]
MAQLKTALVSVSGLEPTHWMAPVIATEALAQEAFGADVYRLEPLPGAIRRELADRGRLRRWGAHAGVPSYRLQPEPPPGVRYDLMMLFDMDLWQTATLEGLRSFPRLATTQVLVQNEVWPQDLLHPVFEPLARGVLDQFDIVYTVLETSLEPLRSRLRADVRFVPQTVDLPAFSGRPGPRPVAVTSLGRRDPAQHRAIAQWADATRRWYFYDATAPGALTSYREHLDQNGQLLQRSAIWVANRAGYGDDARTQGAREVGLRFYEGLAAGCALLGECPPAPEFERSFAGLPGLIPMDIGQEHVPEGVERMMRDERFATTVATTHQARALRTCDFAHLLRTIAQDAGVPVPDMIDRRIRALAARADQLEGRTSG